MRAERTPPEAAAGPLLSADEAAERLGVQRATLYAYVSRGWLRSVAGSGRSRLYPVDEVERLRARTQARSGHAPVAAAALRWGDPVISSEITAITAEGPRYRGVSAIALVEGGSSYEAVAELLWRGPQADANASAPAPWRVGKLGLGLAALRRDLGARVEPLDVIRLAIAVLGAREAAVGLAEAAELALAQGIIVRLAALAGLAYDEANARAAARAEGMAKIVAQALVGRGEPAIVQALEAALILSADHELNTSTFAARVVASTGADLHACLGAAAAAIAGPRHGGACARVEYLVDESGTFGRPEDVVRERFARGESVPGFGHKLYPGGDPRAAYLLELATERGRRVAALRRLRAIAGAMADAGHPAPTLDFGLVALCEALALPRGSATALFALGRTAGWVAHVQEQRRQGFLLRPTARYVGPGAGEGGPV